MDEAAPEDLPDPSSAQRTLEIPAMLRAARHFADLSQRELAALAGISKSSLGDLESGDATAPPYPVVVRLIEAAGLRLQVVTSTGLPLTPRPLDGVLDKGGRHWPAHLDVLPVHSDRDWWYSRLRPGERPLPAFTADWRRLQGRWRVRRTKGQSLAEARARAQARNTPPPVEVPDADPADG